MCFAVACEAARHYIHELVLFETAMGQNTLRCPEGRKEVAAFLLTSPYNIGVAAVEWTRVQFRTVLPAFASF